MRYCEEVKDNSVIDVTFSPFGNFLGWFIPPLSIFSRIWSTPWASLHDRNFVISSHTLSIECPFPRRKRRIFRSTEHSLPVSFMVWENKRYLQDFLLKLVEKAHLRQHQEIEDDLSAGCPFAHEPAAINGVNQFTVDIPRTLLITHNESLTFKRNSFLNCLSPHLAQIALRDSIEVVVQSCYSLFFFEFSREFNVWFRFWTSNSWKLIYDDAERAVKRDIIEQLGNNWIFHSLVFIFFLTTWYSIFYTFSVECRRTPTTNVRTTAACVSILNPQQRVGELNRISTFMFTFDIKSRKSSAF